MIVVTGASGNSGTFIVNALSSAGQPCRALVRDRAKAKHLEKPGVELVTGDLADPASLDAAFRGATQLMLIPPPNQHVVELDGNAVAAAKRAGLGHVVKFSVDGADVDSPVRFARLNAQSEAVVKQSGLAWTVLRPTFFMQNLLGMAGMIKAGTVYADAGDGKAAHVDLADIAAVAVAALTQPGHQGETYRLTGPSAHSFGEVAALFQQLLGHPVAYANVPHPQMKASLVKAGVPEWQAEGVTELSEVQSKGWTAEVSDAVQHVAGRPAKTLEQWARENLAAFR